MQIRERGGKIEFLRSEYVPMKKRSTQRLIGSQSRYGAECLVEDLRDKLTEEEIAQAEVWFKEKVNKTKEWSRAHNIRYAHQKLEELAAAIKEQPELVTLEVAAKTYKGIDLVATALRK